MTHKIPNPCDQCCYKLKNSKKGKYITIVRDFRDSSLLKVGTLVQLVHEPDNTYDDEAIKVCSGHNKFVGYVANSVSTVVRGTNSAGRIYDKILDGQFAVIQFVSEKFIIAEVDI